MRVATNGQRSGLALFRTCAWLCAIVLVLLTLSPVQFRPSTIFPRSLEHFLAFAVAGAAFGVAYPRHRMFAAILGLLALPLLEIMQMLAPGRHAQFVHTFMNIAGIWAGLALVALVKSWFRPA